MSGKRYLYEQVYDSLKEKIESGAYGCGDLLPSEREIGETFNVDRTTVRQALKMMVADGLVEKQAGVGTRVVQQAPPAHKPSLSRMLAFFLPTSTKKSDRITEPFYATLFYNLEKECKNHNYTLVYSTLDSNDDFPAILQGNNYAGIFFTSNVDRRFIDYALSAGIPSVLLNDYYPPLMSVVPDNFYGMISACEHLLSLGHRRFALIKGISSYLSTAERYSACVVAFQRAGLDIENMYSEETTWESGSGYTAARNILEKAAGDLPTAIIAFNDSLAMAALQAVHEKGLRVPEDISVVGFDDIEQVKHTYPPLTTVSQNIPLFAKTALHNLLTQLDNPSDVYKVRVIIPSTLVVRNSTGVPNASRPPLQLPKKAARA